MNKEVLRYQNAFNNIIDKMTKNEEILGVMAFGSVLTGDLWEESDIDMLVVVGNSLHNRKNIYLTENDITVHIKVIKKEEFLNFNKNNLRGGKLHRILISSRLMFSRDHDVTNTFNSFKYYPEQDKEKWNLTYLSRVLKCIGVCKKYLHNKRIYTAYENSIKLIDDFSMLFLNYNGYLVSKDATTLAVELNEEFKNKVDKLIFFKKEDLEGKIIEVIQYIEEYISYNLKGISKILIEFLENEEKYMSVEEIENNDFFSEFSMDLQVVMDKLYKEDIIKKSKRPVLIINRNTKIEENVYGAINLKN